MIWNVFAPIGAVIAVSGIICILTYFTFRHNIN